jgi:hypothetical protein
MFVQIVVRSFREVNLDFIEIVQIFMQVLLNL